MSEDGDTKDDVKMPDGEVGDKITRLFTTEEKDTSKSPYPTTVMLPELVESRARRCSQVSAPDVVILTAMGEQAAIEAKEAPRQS